MMRTFAAWGLLAVATIVPARAGDFDGEWRTSFGIVTLKQNGDDVSGTYGNPRASTITGTVDGKKFNFKYEEAKSRGEGKWTLDESGNAFGGGYKSREGQAGE